MPDKISILKESGETLNSNVVSVFLIPDTQKRYIITTENAVDPHGLTVLHVSEIVDGTLQKVATDEEWSSIKTIMRAIISGNVGTFKYLPTIENIKASSQYSRDISVSASASKQMIDNYAAGDKSDVNNEPSSDSVAGVSPQVFNQEAPMQQNPGYEASSIFPAATSMPNAENELIPGIAEVSNNDMNNQNLGQQVDMEQQINMNNNFNSPVQPFANISQNQVNVTPEMPANQMGIDNTMMNNAQGFANQIPQNYDMQMSNEASTGIQVAVPTQMVPSAQIAQEAQAPFNNNINLNFQASPSFAPNASLDEVVVGAEQMFIEGVKNLVETIQEKVYRDLYAKEMELKNKEAELAQREAQLNNQMPQFQVNPNQFNQNMMNMGVSVSPTQFPNGNISGFDSGNMAYNNGINSAIQNPNQMGMGIQPSMQMNGVVQNQPSTIIQQPISGPMVVSASNDMM